MKKLLLIICTAALLCLAGVANAQQQEQRSNQYRNTPNQQRTDTTTNDDQDMMQADQNNQPESEVEVVESKEGPNSEVVYKFQGEMFYVDRNEKKIVKADESELKDATHKTIVKENTTTGNDATSTRRRNRNDQ